MLFSDESSVQQFSLRVQHVWRPSGEQYHEKYTVPTVKHPPSQMVWRAMSAAGTGGLYFLTHGTTMNGELDGSLPANPVNHRRVANAVTLKSTFCLP